MTILRGFFEVRAHAPQFYSQNLQKELTLFPYTTIYRAVSNWHPLQVVEKLGNTQFAIGGKFVNKFKVCQGF
ncbi:MAG: hypothetical protein CMO74_00940 [Verrucomicrobiales bacterium]|nr:hypothetical protein [Verrucomicrobiales bacterium]